MRTPSYERAQTAWPLWIIMAITSGGLFALAGFGAHRDSEAPLVLGITAVAMPIAILLVFGRLVIAMDEAVLAWRFGFLPVPRWRLAISEIAAVNVARTNWLEGWGIHLTKQGWLYNATGFSAVRLTLRDGRVLRLGTEEPQRLATFIRARLSAQR